MLPSLTVIVPAYNESANIESTIRTVRAAIGERFADHEILIFNDCSKDDTGARADALARQFPTVKVIHNETNRGLGYNYRKGVEIARMDYVTMIPGDNEIEERSVESIFAQTGRADVVIPYTANQEIRPWSRRLISRSFTTFVNLVFGHRLKYYNGCCVHRRTLLQSVPIDTEGFAYSAAILVRLLRKGATFVETPMYIKAREHGATKAFRLKNIASVVSTLVNLIVEVHFRSPSATAMKEAARCAAR